MKMKAVIVAIILVLFSTSIMADETIFFSQFNTLQELHEYFTTSPTLSAGYIQGVVDMESMEAWQANNQKENAWHVCMTTHPELSTAPKISILVDAFYAANPSAKDEPAALNVIVTIAKACGLSSAHDAPPIHMGAPIPGGKRA